jgi:hypothetical protein
MERMMTSLRDEITAIVEKIADGNKEYWGDSWMWFLDQDAVIADIIAAVMRHDGEEVLEVFGAA